MNYEQDVIQLLEDLAAQEWPGEPANVQRLQARGGAFKLLPTAVLQEVNRNISGKNEIRSLKR